MGGVSGSTQCCGTEIGCYETNVVMAFGNEQRAVVAMPFDSKSDQHPSVAVAGCIMDCCLDDTCAHQHAEEVQTVTRGEIEELKVVMARQRAKDPQSRSGVSDPAPAVPAAGTAARATRAGAVEAPAEDAAAPGAVEEAAEKTPSEEEDRTGYWPEALSAEASTFSPRCRRSADSESSEAETEAGRALADAVDAFVAEDADRQAATIAAALAAARQVGGALNLEQYLQGELERLQKLMAASKRGSSNLGSPSLAIDGE